MRGLRTLAQPRGLTRSALASATTAVASRASRSRFGSGRAATGPARAGLPRSRGHSLRKRWPPTPEALPYPTGPDTASPSFVRRPAVGDRLRRRRRRTRAPSTSTGSATPRPRDPGHHRGRCRALWHTVDRSIDRPRSAFELGPDRFAALRDSAARPLLCRTPSGMPRSDTSPAPDIVITALIAASRGPSPSIQPACTASGDARQCTGWRLITWFDPAGLGALLPPADAPTARRRPPRRPSSVVPAGRPQSQLATPR
jgi:hypothetical protein